MDFFLWLPHEILDFAHSFALLFEAHMRLPVCGNRSCLVSYWICMSNLLGIARVRRIHGLRHTYIVKRQLVQPPMVIRLLSTG